MAGLATIWRSTKGPVKIFLVITYIWQKDVLKISKESGAQRDVNPARQ